MSIEEAFEETVLHYRLNEKVRDIAYIQAMQEQVHAFSTSRIADLPLFLKWWDETGAAQSISLPRNRNAITVITIHKAKGLQYKAVVLPDCDWSLQPKTGSLIWGRTDEKPFDSLKHMPLGWSKLTESPPSPRNSIPKRSSRTSTTSTYSTWPQTRADRNCTSRFPEAAKRRSGSAAWS